MSEPAGQPPTFDQQLLLTADVGAADAARIQDIAHEFARGFSALAGLGPAVTIFGSARTPREHPDYELVRATAAHLGTAGYAIITGGGGGLMEAANRGARDVGAMSVGCGIELPREEPLNDFLDVGLRFTHFFARKVMFLRYALACVIAPGGYGTLDELFEVLTLTQTRTVRHFPAILLDAGGEWDGLRAWLRERPLADGRIDAPDIDLMHVIDVPAQALAIVDASRERQRTDAGGRAGSDPAARGGA